eukprot:CAMPEP_0175096848 /NCGR_PEP_ID=MMETSP0086_2-20121207/4957_1 /TAXON_ID=136419 /ORGANISM="Unknown Unknown, Strain D1" /LENGTH=250 /DNA_ID=CAMNT_0016370289 /DNA_START=22 /DNA_END=771 /DNA_ORIENTATION=-
MSNIRGLGDYNNAGPAGGQGGGGGAAQRAYVGAEEDPRQGIPMTPAPESGPHHIPSIRERIMPRFKYRTFTFFIAMVDIVMMIVTLIVGGVKFGGAFVASNDMAGPSTECLQYMGGKSTELIRKGEVWRLVTPIFLHAGILHLAMNLLFTLHFGFTMEVRWGMKRYIAVYFIGGIGASLLSSCASSAISVGASGALFAILGAGISYLVLNWHDIPGNAQEMCILCFVVIINFLMGSISTNSNGQSSSVDW